MAHTKPQQKGRKEGSEWLRGGEIRSSLLILYLKDESGNQEEGKTFINDYW